jgi:lipopolysaccharide biosynthesis protein
MVGHGFTEWTNVTKALPRYIGHYQSKLPGDLGFYDLSNPDHIRRQVSLAKRGAIYGFCIHNYWFSGRTLLDTPLKIILAHKDIDIRFCLNWANELEKTYNMPNIYFRIYPTSDTLK